MTAIVLFDFAISRAEYKRPARSLSKNRAVPTSIYDEGMKFTLMAAVLLPALIQDAKPDPAFEKAKAATRKFLLHGLRPLAIGGPAGETIVFPDDKAPYVAELKKAAREAWAEAMKNPPAGDPDKAIARTAM